MADLLEEKQRINEADLLDEGKFSNFAKAAALGASLALSPLHAGETHELEVAELPADLISSYNELEENPVLTFAVAQAMADEMITKVGDEAVSMAPEETEAWGTAKATYEYLKTRDDKIAVAFLGKFNSEAKKLFGNQIRPTRAESMELPIAKKLYEGLFDIFRRKTETTPETPHVGFNDFVEQVKTQLRDKFEFADSAANSAIKEFYLIVKKFYIDGKSALDTAATIDDEFLTNDPTWWKRYKDTPMKEAFIKNDRGTVSEEELAQAILNKIGVTGNKYYQDAARYIAAFYSKQSLPKNGMIMWGSRDIKSFFAKHDTTDVKSAIGSTRSIMLGNPTTKAEWIEKNKAEIKRERAEEAEAKRQAYLNSDEYRRSQDPGWTGPRGTWTLGT